MTRRAFLLRRARAALGRLALAAQDAHHVARTLFARELAAALLRHLPEQAHPRHDQLLGALRERANRVRLADLAAQGAQLWDRAGRPPMRTFGDFLRYLAEAEILLSAERSELRGTG